MNLRSYYVSAIDERTGEPCLDEMLEAGCPADALSEAHREAAFRAGHLEVRVTNLAEQAVDATGAVARSMDSGRAEMERPAA